MHVSKIESKYEPGFTAINSKAVDAILKNKRLIGLTTGRQDEFMNLVEGQKDNPLEIVIEKGPFKSLKAKIVNEDGDIVWMHKERTFDGIRNINPNRLIQAMCTMADFFKNSPKWQKRWVEINKSETKKHILF